MSEETFVMLYVLLYLGMILLMLFLEKAKKISLYICNCTLFSLTSYNYYLQWSFISGVLTNILFSDHLAMRPQHQNPEMTAGFTALLQTTN